MHHNDHTHTQLFTTGSTGSAPIQYHGIGTYSYEFRLTATDSSGLTHTTSVTLPVLSDTIPPSDPSGLAATVVSPSQINLTWTAASDNSGSTGYGVERCQGIGCTSFVQIATTSTNSYSDIGLTAGTSYSYRIR
ncbi:MAG: fibronectin type III domain-containing protein, partial [Nitrospirales bacterium]